MDDDDDVRVRVYLCFVFVCRVASVVRFGGVCGETRQIKASETPLMRRKQEKRRGKERRKDNVRQEGIGVPIGPALKAQNWNTKREKTRDKKEKGRSRSRSRGKSKSEVVTA